MSNVKNILNDLATEQSRSLDYVVGLGTLIALESKDQTFIDTVKSKFYEFVDHMHGFFNSLKVGNYKTVFIEANDMLAKLNEQGWEKNRELHITVVPGFQGHWVELLDLMINKILPAAEGAVDGLKVSSIRLAAIMNEPDRLKAQSGIRELESHLTLISKEDLDKLTAHFKFNSQSKATLGDVAGRNTDLKEAYGQINILNKRLGQVDLTKIDSQVERLGELIKAFTKTIDGDEKRAEVSGAVASQLSELMYRLGTTLTGVAQLIELTRQQTEAMQKTLVELGGKGDGDHEFR